MPELTIERYLDEVDAYLHVDRAHRQRVLAEIEGHLHDAVEAHITSGVAPEDAVQRAIAEIGPPQEVAIQFSPRPLPARSVRGWRRWAPIVVPVVCLGASVALTLWSVLYLARYGFTRGGQLALRHSVLYAVVLGALSGATLVAIRNGDRDPSWRRAAWGFAALAGVTVAMSYAI